MTKRDIKLIIILALISILGLGAYGIYTKTNKKDVATVEIYYHSNVVHTMDFNKDDTYELTGDYGKMIIEVKDHMVRVKEVECPNHICEYMYWVEQGSMIPIYCVPNDIMIREKIVD